MTENEIARQVLDAAFLVHTKLGPGLLETVYEVVLAHELRKKTSRTSAPVVPIKLVRAFVSTTAFRLEACSCCES